MQQDILNIEKQLPKVVQFGSLDYVRSVYYNENDEHVYVSYICNGLHMIPKLRMHISYGYDIVTHVLQSINETTKGEYTCVYDSPEEEDTNDTTDIKNYSITELSIIKKLIEDKILERKKWRYDKDVSHIEHIRRSKITKEDILLKSKLDKINKEIDEFISKL